MKLLISLLAMIAMVIAVSAGGDDMVTFPKKLDVTGFRAVFAEVDNLYISGQPEAASFEKLKEMGVTTVINLRTRREMDTREYVPFDEKEVVEQLGMDYIHIPLGGDDNPYNRAALDSFAKLIIMPKAKHCCIVRWPGVPVTCGRPI